MAVLEYRAAERQVQGREAKGRESGSCSGRGEVWRQQVRKDGKQTNRKSGDVARGCRPE